jgi:hypothetical protein
MINERVLGTFTKSHGSESPVTVVSHFKRSLRSRRDWTDVSS